MVDSPSRRSVLRATAATVGLGLAGCSLNNPEVEGGHLFVENTETTDHQVQVVVTEGTDREGNEIVANWYRVPADYALRFRNVVEAGTAYTITAHRPDVPPEDRVTVTVPQCEEDGQAARDVSVRVRADGMGVIPWNCDEDYTQLDLEYVDPDQYAIETPDAADSGG